MRASNASPRRPTQTDSPISTTPTRQESALHQHLVHKIGIGSRSQGTTSQPWPSNPVPRFQQNRTNKKAAPHLTAPVTENDRQRCTVDLSTAQQRRQVPPQHPHNLSIHFLIARLKKNCQKLSLRRAERITKVTRQSVAA